MQRGEIKNPVTEFILIYVTCGIYGIIFLLRVMNELNAGLGREVFKNPVMEIVLTFVTCGLWGLWVYWRIDEAAVELQRAWGVQPEMDAPILFILNFVYVGPLFLQKSLNNAWENGTPGGAGGYVTAM